MTTASHGRTSELGIGSLLGTTNVQHHEPSTGFIEAKNKIIEYLALDKACLMECTGETAHVQEAKDPDMVRAIA